MQSGGGVRKTIVASNCSLGSVEGESFDSAGRQDVLDVLVSTLSPFNAEDEYETL